MNNTAIEDLFLREETLGNTVTKVIGAMTATAVAALTSTDVTSNNVVRLTTAGTIGSTAYAAGDYVKATVANTTVTWAKTTSSSDTAGYILSDVRDWKRWGRDYTKDLGIAVWLEGAADFTAGALTVRLLSGATPDNLAVIEAKAASVSSVDRNGRLVYFLLPRTGIKQYVAVEAMVTTQFAQGDTAATPVVSIGLENDAENDIDMTMVQPKIG